MIFFLTFYILHLKQIEREPLGSSTTQQTAGKPPTNNNTPGPSNNPNKPNNSPGSPPTPPTPPTPLPSSPSAVKTISVTPKPPVAPTPSVYRSLYNKVVQRIENEASLIIFTQGKKALDYLWSYFMPPTSPPQVLPKQPPVPTVPPTPKTSTDKPSQNPEPTPIAANLSGDNCKIETYFFVPPGCENKGKLCIIKQSCGESSLEAICPSTECTSLNPEERMQKCTGSTAVSFISESKGPNQQKTQKK